MEKKQDIQWLKGVRVLLIGHYIPAPLAACLLHALGAEVIKVEPPFGDLLRQYPPYLQGKSKPLSAYFRALNGGFKSIAIDFKKEKGVEVLRKLIVHSDLVFDGNRAGYLSDKLKSPIGEINPNCLHVSISAFGNQGPRKDQAGHDNNLLALAGNLSYTSTAQGGKASVFSVPVADMTSSFAAALSGLAFLIGRGKGSQVNFADASLLHSAMFLNTIPLAGMNATQEPPQADKEWMNGQMANYSVYRCRDGKQVFLGSLEPHLFQHFCAAVGKAKWMDLLLGQQWGQLKAEVEQLFGSQDLEHWEKLLRGVDCCFTPLYNLAEALEEPQIKALGLVREIMDEEFGSLRLTNFPAGFGEGSLPVGEDAAAPDIGEHTQEILHAVLKLNPSEITELLDSQIVKG